MVMEMFRLRPDEESPLAGEDEEQPAATVEDDDEPASPSDSSTPTEDNEEADDEDSDDDGPVSRAKYEADMEAIRQELRTLVGRATANARQVVSATNAEAMSRLRENNLATAQLFTTLVESIDESAMDPAMRSKVIKARDEIMAAEQRAQMLDELRRELGVNPQAEEERDELDAMQEKANELAQFLEDTIVDAGLDPNDEEQFPWKQWAAIYRTQGERAARSAAMKAIRAAQSADQAGSRREARRSSAGRGPKGGAASAPKNPLRDGSLDDRKKALDELLGRR